MTWRGRARAAWTTVREVVALVRDRNITFMAGSIAHAAFLSLLPLVLLTLVATAAVGGGELEGAVAGLAQEYLSPTGENLVSTALAEAAERAGASALGVVTLLWGMLRVFRSLSTAFDELYGERSTGLLHQLVDGIVAFVVVLLATVGTAAGVTLLAVGGPLSPAVGTALTVLGLCVAFYPMYYRFPEADVGPREAVPGTVVAAVGWVVLQVVFGLYVDLAGTLSVYGLLGSVILLLIWLYGVAFVLLVGAAVNVVLAGRHRPVAAPSGVGVTSGGPDDASADRR